MEANKQLFMMRSLYHMSLLPGPNDGCIKVSGAIFHVSRFEKSTKTEDIIALFVAAFNCRQEDVEIVWIDDFGAFAVVSESAMNAFNETIEGDLTTEHYLASVSVHLPAIQQREQDAANKAHAAFVDANADTIPSPGPAREIQPWIIQSHDMFTQNKEQGAGSLEDTMSCAVYE